MTGTRYEVKITVRAERDLHRLPVKVAAACVEFIFGILAENPQRLGNPLVNELAGLRSARRGSYRVIYRIEERALVVEVVRIGHRAAVYG